MCQSPSDRGAFHRSALVMQAESRKIVSIPFRSGRPSQKSVAQSRGTALKCQSPSDRGVLHRSDSSSAHPGTIPCQSPSDRGVLHSPPMARG